MGLILLLKKVTFTGARIIPILMLIVSPAIKGFQSTSENEIREPFAMREDFQGEGLGQWASYPPAQDIGYEPSLSPTTDFAAPGGRSLVRIVRPPGPGQLRFGFIKRLNLIVSSNFRISLSYRLNSPSSGKLVIGLAGMDACRYTAKLPAQLDAWTSGEVRLNQFRDEKGRTLNPGVAIEAIYINSVIEKGSPDTTYRFLIDNIAVDAERKANFTVTRPATVQIDPWTISISNSAFAAKDTVGITASAPVKLIRAECIIKNGDRIVTKAPLYDNATNGDRQSGDEVWSNESVYNFSDTDPPGVWTAELRGFAKSGAHVTTSLRFIVHPPKLGHPRLFFTASDRDILVKRTTDPRTSALWTALREKARVSRTTGDLSGAGATFELLGKDYLLPTLLGYFDVLNRARARISSNSFDAYITHDDDSREAAKRALLDVVRWSRWNPPWFEQHGQHTYYPAGQLAVDVAFGYDLLYEELSSEERSTIRKALIEKAIIPTYKEYVLDNRAMANTSNWISHTVGGALIAAAAIVGDAQVSESDGKLETYINGLLLKLEDHMAASFLADGSYGEGISYQEFDLETLGVALPALRRAFGIDYYAQTHVKDSFLYSLYTVAQPTTESLDMGDSHPPSARTLGPLVVQSPEPSLRWYFQLFNHSSLIDLIFSDFPVQPEPPTFPSSRIFAVKGNASFRTGWKPDDWLLLFRAGPTFNHNHSDQGSFQITAFGENLVSEAGWSDYYKDPYYDTYFTQAIGHNTVLVNGDPQSQSIADTAQFKALDSYPRITDAITSDFYDSVSADLSSVYKDRLARYVRRIVFVKPHYFVIYDDLVSNDGTASFDWLLHLPDRAGIVATSKTGAVYSGSKASLAVQVLNPVDAELTIRDGHIPYPVFANTTPKVVPLQPAFLQVRSGPAKNAQFLTVLVPSKRTSDASVEPNTTRIAGPGYTGLTTKREKNLDVIGFRNATNPVLVKFQNWTTDADAWTITLSEGQVKMFAVQAARSLVRDGRQLFNSDQAISLAAQFSEEIQISCNATGPTTVNFFVGTQPTVVQLDQTEVNKSLVRFNDGIVTVTVPQGQHTVRIRFR